MGIEDLISRLGDEIEDPDEETFLLFAQPIPSHNLGFIDPKASSVEVTIHDKDYTIHQSPTVLSSTRAGGTTGAVLWKINPLFASFISSPNLLTSASILAPSASVLELGCGISPLNGLALAPHVAHYLLTDQPYVQRFITRNIDENHHHHQAQPKQKQRSKSRASAAPAPSPLQFATLDWETDQVTGDLAPGSSGDFDLVLACDCVYNEALVRPLVLTCADACRLRATKEEANEPLTPCVCVVAQQLRSDEVFQRWLTEFQAVFRVWRYPDDLLPEQLRPDAGFVVHVGVLRE